MGQYIEEWEKKLGRFTHSVYSELLIYLKDFYKIIPFSEIKNTKKPYLILRHDIDASISEALKLAKIENTLNISSTYFVLLSNKYYNILDKQNFKFLREIVDLNHEIGIHYDLTIYETYQENLQPILENEIKFLEKLIKRKITCISCHNPSLNNSIDPFIGIKNYINAYDKHNYDLYVSDSCRSWYIQDLKILLNKEQSRAQLLIHPILWTEIECRREEVLERFFQKIQENNEDDKRKWIDIWNNTEKVRNYEKMIRKL